MKQLLCIAALALSAFGCASDEPMSAATKSILEQSAAKAMQAFATNESGYMELDVAERALLAYLQADAMLKERAIAAIETGEQP